MSTRFARSADKSQQERSKLILDKLLQTNRFCADCKKNDHPRWASWNIGVFMCIRCAGIHRSLGTHISRVKSVDLDTWTDDQLKSMIKWGNKRANKYWEAGLSPGHVPSDSKMENFIRTKYDSKRWALASGIPQDTSIFDDDRDVDAAVRPSKRSSLLATSSNLDRDLLSNTPPPITAQKSTIAAPQISKSSSSLLDFDPSRSNSPAQALAPITRPSVNQPSRSELKTSILSLYSKTCAAPSSSPASQAMSLQSAGSHTTLGAFTGLAGAFNTTVSPTKRSSSIPSNSTSPTAIKSPSAWGVSPEALPKTQLSPSQPKVKLSGFDGIVRPMKSAPNTGVAAGFGNAWESPATDDDDFGSFQDIHSTGTDHAKPASTAAFGDDGLFSTADVWK